MGGLETDSNKAQYAKVVLRKLLPERKLQPVAKSETGLMG